jgi:hypothetical protein
MPATSELSTVSAAFQRTASYNPDSVAWGVSMKRFVEGEDRSQSTLFPERLDDYIVEDNPVRVVDVFVDELDLKSLGFDGINQKSLAGPPTIPQRY